MSGDFSAVINQVIIIFIFVILGYILSKTKKLTDKGTSEITSLVLTVVNPCVIVNAFITSFTLEMLPSLLMCFAASILIHIIAIFGGKLIFKGKDNPILRFAVTYSNCGFMAFPIIESVLGKQGVVYGSVYLAVFNCFVWTHGLSSLIGNQKGKKMSPKAFVNPGVIAIIIAILLVLLKIDLPYIIERPIEMLGALNTPLAMTVTGAHLASAGLKKAFTDKRAYGIAFLRLLVLPVIMTSMMCFMGISTDAIKALIISSGTPTASITVLFASTYRNNVSLAGGVIAVTTLLSMITLPVLVLLSDYIFR